MIGTPMTVGASQRTGSALALTTKAAVHSAMYEPPTPRTAAVCHPPVVL